MAIIILALLLLIALCVIQIVILSRESKRNYKFFHLLENSPDGFRIVENGLMTYSNSRFCEMTGYSKSELFEKPYQLIFTSESLPIVEENIKLRTQLQSSSYEAELLRKDGSSLPVIVAGQPVVDKNGNRIGNCGVFTDISKLKMVEADLRLAEQRLFHSQKLEALGQLSGGIAHDFNNLLAVIIGNLEILNERYPNLEGASKYIDRAIQGANKASGLTRRLLAFSRKQGLNSKSTNLNALIVGITDLLSGSVGGYITINVNIPSDLWSAQIDAAQLETVLVNLVINSKDAMPNGGTILISCENKNFSEKSDYVIAKNLSPGDYIKLSVEDNGEGIAPENITRIFEPFFTTKGVGKGNGLGMSIAYGFAKESNGCLDVQSELKKGTIVSLYLPRSTEKDL